MTLIPSAVKVNNTYFLHSVFDETLSSNVINITGTVVPEDNIPKTPGDPAQVNFTVTIQSNESRVVNDLQFQLTCNNMKVHSFNQYTAIIICYCILTLKHLRDRL